MADWQLHLTSIRRMINLFTATGHNNYAKCARLYIESMSELPMPMSLFKDNFMRKADKSQLGKEICKGVTPSTRPPSSVHVIDGGYLLRVVQWCAGTSYADIFQQYVCYVGRHYGQSSVVVFDGYCSGAHTKNHEHKRRLRKFAPDIVVDVSKTAYKDQFFNH